MPHSHYQSFWDTCLKSFLPVQNVKFYALCVLSSKEKGRYVFFWPLCTDPKYNVNFLFDGF